MPRGIGHWVCVLGMMGLLWLGGGLTHANAPNIFTAEALIAHTNADGTQQALSGQFAVIFELITDDDTVLFRHESTPFIFGGQLIIRVTPDDAFNSDIFRQHRASARITLQSMTRSDALVPGEPTAANVIDDDQITLPIRSINHSFFSNTAISTDTLTNHSLLHVSDTPTIHVAIATPTPNDALNVNGTLKAVALTGDGSKLLNLGITTWAAHDQRIHYMPGNVGIHTATPNAPLHVSGNMKMTGVSPTTPHQQLTIYNQLIATFNGTAPNILNMNANNIATGILTPDTLMGHYPKIAQLGTISDGEWRGTAMGDAMIPDDIYLSNAAIDSLKLSGQLTLANDTTWASVSDRFPLRIQTNRWVLADNARMAMATIHNTMVVSGNTIVSPTLIIGPESQTWLRMDAIGNVALGDAPTSDTPLAFTPHSGLVIGPTVVASPAPGTLYFDNGFKGQTDTGQPNDLDAVSTITGHSLSAKDGPETPIIHVTNQGFVGSHTSYPIDAFHASGNVVLLGNALADPPSNYIKDGDAMVWVANKGALRIGTSSPDNAAMMTPDAIGNHSVAMGSYAAAPGKGAINITRSESTQTTSATGDFSVLIAAPNSTLQQPNTIVLAANSVNNVQENSIILSAKGQFTQNTTTANNWVLNGILNGSPHEYAITGGQYAPQPMGDHSWIWDSSGLAQNFSGQHDKSFIIGPETKVGINTNEFNSDDVLEAMVVNGRVTAKKFIGSGHLLTGDIQITSLQVTMNGEIQDIKPSILATTSPVIYASNRDGHLPENTVNADSIANGTLTGDDIDGYALGHQKFANNTLEGRHFAINAITAAKLQIDQLDSTKFSDITGASIDHAAITADHLKEDSIHTTHITPNAVVTRHLLNNSITTDHLAEGAIQEINIKAEPLNTALLANDVATGETIGIQAIASSHMVVDSPQIHTPHLANNSVTRRHLPNDALTQQKLNQGAVHTEDIADADLPDAKWPPDPVFMGRHFNDGAIDTETLATGFTLNPDQINTNGVTSPDIKSTAITLSHMANGIIGGNHIQAGSLPTVAFEDQTIARRHLAVASVASRHIQNGSILAKDIAPNSIHGRHIQPNAIDSSQLAPNAIASINIHNNSVDSSKIVNKSLTTDDFKEGAFTAIKFKNGTIVSKNLAVGAITIPDLSDTFEVTANQFKDDGVSWDDFTQDAPFPVDRFGNNTLDYNTKFKSSPLLNGDKFSDASIGALALDIPTFSVDQLATPLAVSKGGTGLTSFIKNAIVFVNNDGQTMGQSNDLQWHPEKNQLRIQSPTNTPNQINAGVAMKGNLLIESGALILEDLGDDQYSFVRYNDTDQAIQLAYKQPLSATDSNVSIKTHTLMVQTRLAIGGATPVNGIDLNDHFQLGYPHDTPPENGLIIAGSMQIGGETTDIQNTATHPLIIYDGIARATGTNRGLVVTGDSTHPSPLITEGRRIVAQGVTGIMTTGNIGMTITVNAQQTAHGIHTTLQPSASPSPSSHWVHVTMNGTDITTPIHASLGHIQSINGASHYMGIYATIPDTTKNQNYAAYLDGNVNTKALTVADSAPSEGLTVDSFNIDGLVAIQPQTNVINAIDWTQGNMVDLTVDNNHRNISFIRPPEASSKLIILVKHTGHGRVTFMDDTIIWADGYEPELTAENGRVDVVVLTYNHHTQRYYGGAAYNFMYTGNDFPRI
jgi:hypothetical protein